jgi:sugar phosphate permease
MPDFKNKIDAQVDNIEQKEKASSSNAIMKEAYWYSLKTPSVLFSILMSGFVLLGSTAISVWGVTLYTRTYGMNVREAAVFIGYIGIATVFIPILLGKMADIILKKRPDGRLIAAVISACIMIVAVFVFTNNSFHSKDLVIAFICFGLLKGFIMASTANANALTNDLVPAYYRTITNSLLPLSQQGIGGVLGPLLCGILSDRVGLDLAFMYVIIISCAVQLLTVLVCKLNLKKDLEKFAGLGKISLEIDK